MQIDLTCIHGLILCWIGELARIQKNSALSPFCTFVRCFGLDLWRAFIWVFSSVCQDSRFNSSFLTTQKWKYIDCFFYIIARTCQVFLKNIYILHDIDFICIKDCIRIFEKLFIGCSHLSLIPSPKWTYSVRLVYSNTQVRIRYDFFILESFKDRHIVTLDNVI